MSNPGSSPSIERQDISNDFEDSETSSKVSLRGGSVSIKYPLLTKTNYLVWSIKMEVYMEAQGVWEAVVSEEPVDPRKDKMALAAIFQGISEDTLLQLGAKKSAKDAWSALRIMHLGAARIKEVRVQALRWDLENLRMEDGDSVDDFTGKISTIVNKLRGLGEKIDQEYVVKKMLRSVSPKFIQIASTIEEFADLSTKTMEEVIGSLKAHEERFRGQEEKRSENLLLTEAEWKARDEKKNSDTSSSRNQNARDHGRGRGFGRSRWKGCHHCGYGREDEEQQKFDIKKVRCYACNEFGHFASDCKTKKTNEEETHLLEYNDDEPTLLMMEACKIIHSDDENEIAPEFGSDNVESVDTILY